MNSDSQISNVRSEIASSASVSSVRSVSSVFNPIRAQLAVETTVDASDSDILHIRVSDETLDRYKEVIVASGWRLDNYLRNPVIQNAHQYGDIIFTIGRAEKTWVSGNALLQTWRFASNENPFAKIARDLYRGKFLQAASVGFVPIKWEDPESSSSSFSSSSSMAESQVPTRRYLEQELLEVSAVGIPANPNALTLALKAGAVEKSDLRELFALLKHLIAERNADWQSAVPQTGSLPRCADSLSALECASSSCSFSFSNPEPQSMNPEICKFLPRLDSILLTLNRKENQR